MRANPPPNRAYSPGKRGRLKRSKARNLVERLGKLQKETLRYLHDFRVPFDNNLAYAARGISEVMPTTGLCRVGVAH